MELYKIFKKVFMRWFSLLLLFISSCVYSQSNGPLIEGDDIPEYLQKLGYYVNRVDPIENRIDTLTSKLKSSMTIGLLGDSQYKSVSENNLLLFFELDNLLVLENLDNSKKSFYFLEFLFEEGLSESAEKNYIAKSGENIIIEYHISKEGIRKIFRVTIYDSKSIDYITSFFE